MSRGGPAASADDGDAELRDISPHPGGHLLRREMVMGVSPDVLRNARVRHHEDRHRGVGAEVAEVLLHLLRPRGAVHADGADDIVRLQDRERGGDLGPHQHGAGGLDRHRGYHRNPSSDLLEISHRGRESAFHLERILAGLDAEDIAAAVHQPGDLLPEGGFHLIEPDISEGGELGGGTDRTGHVARALRSRPGVGAGAGDLRREAAQLVGHVGYIVLGQNDRGRTEGVRLDDVRPRLQKAVMYLPDGIRVGDAEILVASFQVWAAEVLGGQRLVLDRGTGGAVEQEDPLTQDPAEVVWCKHAGKVREKVRPDYFDVW